MSLTKNSSRASTVLILDGHSRASAETVLALPHHCTLHVAGVGDDCLSFASSRVALRLQQPVDRAEFLVWLTELDRLHRYDLIVPSTEASLLALKSQAIDPALRAKAVLSDEASIDIALSKQETADVAEQLGIRVPRGRVVAALPSEPPAQFPVVVKPLHSKVMIGGQLRTLAVSVCADELQRQAALRELLPHTPIVEQEYFAGRGVGVEALFEHGQLRWVFAHERLHEMPVTGGASTYRCAYTPPPAVRDAAVALLTHLRWHGVAMVEFKVSPDGQDYRLIEINARLWGSLPLAVGAGVNFPLGLYHLATGQDPGPQPQPTRCRYMREVANDVRWFKESWKQRGNPLLVKPLEFSDFTALLRPLWGRERWDLFRLREWSLWWALSKNLVEGLTLRWETWHARRAANNAARAHWKRLGAQWRRGGIERVLVLCYGNICRSPVVGLMLAQALPALHVRSAGMHRQTGRSSPEAWAETVHQLLDVDLSPHRSRLALQEDMAWAQLVIVMDAENWQSIVKQFPEHVPRATLLAVMAELGVVSEVPDPYGKPAAEMRKIALQLQTCIRSVIRTHAAPHQSTP